MMRGSLRVFAPDVVISGPGESESVPAETIATAAVAEHIATEAAEDIEQLEAQLDNLEDEKDRQWQDLSRLQVLVSELRTEVDQLKVGQAITLETSAEALATAEIALEVATPDLGPSEAETIISETQTEALSETVMEVPAESEGEKLAEAPAAEVVRKSRVRML
jgi:hypothetical protein